MPCSNFARGNRGSKERMRVAGDAACLWGGIARGAAGAASRSGDPQPLCPLAPLAQRQRSGPWETSCLKTPWLVQDVR